MNATRAFGQLLPIIPAGNAFLPRLEITDAVVRFIANPTSEFVGDNSQDVSSPKSREPLCSAE